MRVQVDTAALRELAAWVRDHLLPEHPAPILETTPLISSGLLDSYAVVELIEQVEARFDVEVAPRWHRVEHLDTVECIAKTVEGIRHARPT